MMVRKEFMKSLGNRIKQARIHAGFTQEQLAEMLNLSRGTIARYELGEIEPKLQNLAAIASALHVSADYLMGLHSQVIRTEEPLSEKAIESLNQFIKEVRADRK